MDSFRPVFLIVLYVAFCGGATLILEGAGVDVNAKLQGGVAIYSALAAFIVWARLLP